MRNGDFPLLGCYHICAGNAHTCTHKWNRRATIHTTKARKVCKEDLKECRFGVVVQAAFEGTFESLPDTAAADGGVMRVVAPAGQGGDEEPGHPVVSSALANRLA
eukprot:3638269-Amphidinium_carterae.2